MWRYFLTIIQGRLIADQKGTNSKRCSSGGDNTLPVESLIWRHHYGDVIMGTIASQITSLTIVYSTVYSDADQGKHQSSASLAFVGGIHRGQVNFPHKWPVTREMFPFDDVIMIELISLILIQVNACWLTAPSHSLKQRRLISVRFRGIHLGPLS